MLRSLFSAVSGMQAHQTKLDVIGNNIANVNTYGFKSSRARFQVAGVVPHRQGNVVQQVDRGKDRPRPAVGAAPDDVQRLADPPAVAGIGTGLAAGALPGQDHLALALQGTALGFRQPVQEGRHGLRRRLRCQSQQEQGRRTEDEPVRREEVKKVEIDDFGF